ncbi:MAG TPA: ornithine cyclodeaminase family protein [Candidatus Limnocylindria bacterium]|nr:ornithine cyclodeaminase family protein [Candidatus Limnocylindria bacterium]
MSAILPAVTLLLREADVQRVIEMDPVIAAVEAAMTELGSGTAQNEPRRRAFAPGGLLNVMFASFPGGGCTGLKAYTVAAGKVRFLVALFALDGSLEALIEADHMGAYRTGAATAVAVKALAPGVPKIVALIGAGHQAATQALAVSRVLDIKELRAFSRDPDRRSAFATEQSSRLGIKVVASASAEAAVRGADVIITMTTSSVPVIEAAWVEEHAVIAAAGSNFSNRTELPADLVARAGTIVVDQLATALLESGDLIEAHAAGKFDWERATELGSVLTGTWKPPEKLGITLFESHGLALWDLAAGSVVLAAARERRLGEEVQLF